MHILVTGASTGIGRAIAEACAKRGHFVWACARKIETLQDLKSTYPDHVELLSLDVTSPSDIEAATKKVAAKVDLKQFALINNAGIAIGGPLEAIELKEWRAVFDVNVFGLVEMTKAFLPQLRATKGRIINIGSISGRIATPFLSPYAGSKFAVRAITDALRREMAPFGVGVSLIEPGPIQTPIWEKSMQRSQRMKQEMKTELLPIYSSAIDGLEGGVKKTAKDAVPVSHVVEKVLHALESSRPNAYYLVGKNIRLTSLLVQALPTSLLDKMLASGFRFQDSE